MISYFSPPPPLIKKHFLKIINFVEPVVHNVLEELEQEGREEVHDAYSPNVP